MKSLIVWCCLCCASFSFSQESTFRWGFPALADAQKITPANFPDVDAVIILKEQGFTEGPHTKSLFAIYNETTVSTKAMIVKLFNEKAVETFGSFSYEFPDMRLKEDRHVFTVRARVMKPDGTIQDLPDTSIKRITGISSGHGRALTQRVMYKIPNLAPGDIVQYEYSHGEPWSFKRQVLYFYHDRYPVLRSVVVHVDHCPRERRAEVAHDLLHRGLLVEARNDDGDAGIHHGRKCITRQTAGQPWILAKRTPP